MSKEVRNLYQRILDIMAEVDYIQKDDKKVAGQYRYVSHDSVSKVIHPQLVKHGVVAIPTVKEIKQEGNRTAVCLLVTFINADKPEESICVESIGYGIDSADKGPGKAVSYAFKYCLLKMFCLETGDDPDHEQDVKYEPKLISHAQWESLLEYDVPEMADFKKQVLGHYKIADYSALLEQDFDRVYQRIVKVYQERSKK